MNSTRRTYNPLKPLSICLFGLLALAALVTPGGAAAAAVEGGATLRLAAGAEGLRAAGTVVRGIGEAKQRGGRLQLPAAGLKLKGRGATVSLRGAISLRAGKQKVLLRRIQIRAQGKGVALEAKLGGRDLTVLRNRVKNRKGLGGNADAVKLAGLELTLTGAAAKLLSERLGVAMQGGGKAGSLQLNAARPTTTPGLPGGQTPSAAPISNEPRLLERPATAVDVSGVEVTWFPRDSWIRYVSSGTGPGDGIFVGNGASATASTASPCPDRSSGSSASLPYSISFTPAASWYDPASGKAGIYGSGDVAFRWASHTIDLSAANPEVEINGAESRVIFRFNGSGGTPYPNQRADLLSLDVAAGPTQVSEDGKTFSYEFVRGTLTPNGVNVFAGFYTPPDNDEFGCVSVKFTTP